MRVTSTLAVEMALSPLIRYTNNDISFYMLTTNSHLIVTQCSVQIYEQTIIPLLDYAGFTLIANMIDTIV